MYLIKLLLECQVLENPPSNQACNRVQCWNCLKALHGVDFCKGLVMIHCSAGHWSKGLAGHPKPQHWTGCLPSLQPLRIIFFPSPPHIVGPPPWNSETTEDRWRQAILCPPQMTTFYQQWLSKMLPKEEDSHYEDYGQKVFLRKSVRKSQVKYSQNQKVLSRSAISSRMAWIPHGLTHTGCS